MKGIAVKVMALAGILMSAVSPATAQSKYEAIIDLSAIEDDKLAVETRLPSIDEKKALFVFPKVVPGTYDNSSFGRFVEDFRAYDADGKKLKVKKADVNAYRIKKAHKAAFVTYTMNDTWDTDHSPYIFQPGGSSFTAGEEFVLNNFALLGYVNGITDDIPYQVEIRKPEHLYGATSLDRVHESPGKDIFIAENYVELVDQPILYAAPDTITYYEGGAKVGIAVYSPEDEITAEVIRDIIQPITRATSYVLGTIPTDEYWFLLHYFNWDDPVFISGGGAFGALEHKKSSLYFLPTYLGAEGVDMEAVRGTLYDMATHEFLHILSPLNLHSEEIAYFDFYETELSQHLWLYEGVTEYLSMKSLLLGGLKDFNEFSEEVIGKIRSSKRYKVLSFTEMSKNIIDPEMQKQYVNVYEKGALLAMILDIKTAQVTNGEMDLIDLVLDLIDDYGMGKPFKDDELFDIIAAKTAPELRDFFRRYYEGMEELPLDELFEVCGVEYHTAIGEDKYSFGPFSMDFDANSGLLNITPREANSIIPGTIAVARINDEDLSFSLVRSALMNPVSGDVVKIEHMVDGKLEVLEIAPVLGDGDLEYTIKKMADQTPSQARLFNKLFTSDRQE